MMDSIYRSFAEHGFPCFETIADLETLVERPARYVISRYEHTSLYGEEAEAIVLNDRGTEFRVAPQFQRGTGTTDAKLPLLFQHFLVSPVQNWMIRLDGEHWDAGGRAAVAWLRAHAAVHCPSGRKFLITVGETEWRALLAELFRA
jgi:hypothetical protein